MFFGTANTAERLRKIFPQIVALPHGPKTGDYVVLEWIRRLKKYSWAVEIYAFITPLFEPHLVAKEALIAECRQQNWDWIPTPSMARTYFNAVQPHMEVPHMEMQLFS